MAFWNKENNEDEKTSLVFKRENDSQIENESVALKTSEVREVKEEKKIVRSALCVGTVIQGKLSFDMPVSIDGKLTGELFSQEEVIVGKTAEIEAEIQVKSLEVHGKVKGNIKAIERVHVYGEGVIEGTVLTPSLCVEEGAILNCDCKMKTKN